MLLVIRNKKAPLILSEELFVFWFSNFYIISDLSHYDLAPFSRLPGIGCQGFIGRIPPPFVISDFKELAANIQR
jgi:hypothetical protein